MNALNASQLEGQFTRAALVGDWKQAERIARRGFILCRQVESSCWWQRIKLSQKLRAIQVSAKSDTRPDTRPDTDTLKSMTRSRFSHD